MVSYFRELFNLFYPPICPGCGRVLNESEGSICLYCESELAYLNYLKDEDNPVEQLFWGKVSIERATSMVEYIEGGIAQNMIHDLKYNGNYKVGVELGFLFGQYLKRTSFFDPIDLIVPVPLHFLRLLKRGFNQAEMIAKGMNKALGIEVSHRNLVRVKSNKSQTTKSKEEREENVKDLFTLKDPEEYKGKHVLLVDDIVTTGSTLISGVEALSCSEGIRISIATIGKA